MTVNVDRETIRRSTASGMRSDYRGNWGPFRDTWQTDLWDSIQKDPVVTQALTVIRLNSLGTEAAQFCHDQVRTYLCRSVSALHLIMIPFERDSKRQDMHEFKFQVSAIRSTCTLKTETQRNSETMASS